MPDITADPVLLTREESEAAWAEELAVRQDPSKEASEQGEQVIETVDKTAAAPAQEKPAPTLEDRLAAAEARASAAETKFNTELGRVAGRVAAIQSKMDTAKAAASSTGDGPTDAQIEAAAEDPTEWKQLIEDFPDWGVAFEKKMDAKIAHALRSQKPKKADAPAAEQADDVPTLVQKEVARLEVARVDRKHPAWRDTVKTSEFKAWKETQADEIRALENSASSDDAIEMLNLFEGSKADGKTTNIAQRRKGALEASAVQGKPRQNGAAVKAAGDMTPAEMWALEKRKREQRRYA